MTDKTIRVLLIEDNPGDAKLIQVHLVGTSESGSATMSFDLDKSRSLSEGLEKANLGKYDVLLLDLNLPDSQGISTFTQIHAAFQDTPIIVLTGLDDETLALQALQDGAQDYLIKGSVDTQLLRRAIQYAIERQRVMKLKDDFLASVSHDLKTPLFTIIGFLEMLDEGRLSDPAARKELLERAIHDADRLKALVDDILDMTRFEAGRLKLTVEPIEVSNLVSEAAASVDLLATSKGVTLKSTPPECAIGIQGDRQRLLRVLINLIENAIKFSESGQPIEVCWGAEDGDVEINVIDKGPGIPRKDQFRIFEKFYQVERPGSPSSTGSGLGLYISKNFVEVHGGTLSVKSKLGEGSTFTIQLPVKEKDVLTDEL